MLVANGEAEVGAEIGHTRSGTEAQTCTVSARVAALKALAKSTIPLIIDDFHYLPKDLQGQVIRPLKPLIFDGLPVVIIAIPHRRYDAVKVEKEITGRILPVSIPIWADDELQFISDTGFGLLNFRVPERVTRRLTGQEGMRHVSKRLGTEKQPRPGRCRDT